MERQWGFTPPGSNSPPYLNVTRKADEVVITVRSPAKADGSCGETSAMTMTIGEFIDYLDDLRAGLDGE